MVSLSSFGIAEGAGLADWETVSAIAIVKNGWSLEYAELLGSSDLYIVGT